ncbi:fimbrial protein [Photorhabdus temperata]|uniref:P pilus assembly protein, pilin FimA n=1 Tax=Photorhabdus temperata subsp. temperata Meg1 TaxID=1393735 RepID=A0A081RRK4_PHOTE|nr:fimbrial protein [Photorhabdus temperata]KER01307.1 P pilus assembly protein, pilin FimA [Photorhabdus temperata subsp. temperata Meg1]MCT8349133.1 fimbrial protein [Photorhabdus temperata]
MKKQILKTCAIAALCLGGMSQAMAEEVSAGTLTVSSSVTAETCKFAAIEPVSLAALVSDFTGKADGSILTNTQRFVTIGTEKCPLWSSAKSAKLTVAGTAAGPGASFFQLLNSTGNTAISDHAVGLTINDKLVQPGVAINLKDPQYSPAVAGDNAITLKVGLAKIGPAAVKAADSKANLTVKIAYD